MAAGEGPIERRGEMALMNAAVVTSFDEAPHFQRVEVPRPKNDDDVLVEVLAAGLHPRVRSGAAGRHYTSTGKLPMVPGIDGVGRRADGKCVYFLLDDDAGGSMAEKTVVDQKRAVELPADVDFVKVAAAMNPAMSSWVTLRRRAPLEAGQSVLVLGATGNAGAMAVQVAKRLGAARVIGAGRDRARLEALAGADGTVQLTDDLDVTARALAGTAANVDIVLDYLWGLPAQRAMIALLTERAERSKLLSWVQIGSVAGATIELASVALRSANLRLMGTGQGSVSPAGYLAELPALVDEINSGALKIGANAVPLADVEQVWAAAVPPGTRTVFVP
jgi:NADPH:quinone reductase-like Zn-dependent oxidoreductase